MTHRYTLLVGGIVIPGGDEPDASAVAWAEDTVIALGSDADVASISRGDSHVVDLAGSCVVPLGEGRDARWPVGATIEVGGRADLAVLAGDPRGISGPDGRPLDALALIRSGRVVAGHLPDAAGVAAHEHEEQHDPDAAGSAPAPPTTLTVADREVPVLRRLLGRSIAESRGELRRLRMLSTAYADRPAGQGRDPQIAQVEDDIRVAEDLLRRLGE